MSTDSDGAKPATRAEVSTDSAPVPRPGRAPSASACEPYRELIIEALRRGLNAMAIWQDIVDDHGFAARYASVRRFVLTLKDTCAPEARVVITTAPGEEGQVDYGDGPMVRHPQTGKYRRTRLFVLTLGYSRKAVRLLVWQSSTQVWVELHERAFRRLGGTGARDRPGQSEGRGHHAGHLRSGAQSALPRRVPRELFALPDEGSIWTPAKGGQRFLVGVQVTKALPAPIQVVLNWSEPATNQKWATVACKSPGTRLNSASPAVLHNDRAPAASRIVSDG